jgi:hypothetical protein
MGATMPAPVSAHDQAEQGGMPGMAMPMVNGSLPCTAWISAALGAYLVAAAVWWVLRGMRVGSLASADAEPRPLSWTALCHGLMSAGMGLALLTMA